MYFETIDGDNELVIEQEINSDKKFNNDENENYLLALKLHEELNNKQLKIINSTADVYQLFNQFNLEFFNEKLSSVFVEWSQQMTNYAGVCIYESKGNCCRIILSELLLKLRPRKDLIQTLLHEMIHAYLFLTKNLKDHNEHGSEFLQHMIQINQATGANITISHQFVDEVDHYRKRSINVALSKNDRWFDEHERRCNDQFIKVKEPSNQKKIKNNVHSLLEPSSKKVKLFSADQSALDKFLVKPTAFVECHFCHESVHKANLRLHLDMKCPMRVQ